MYRVSRTLNTSLTQMPLLSFPLAQVNVQRHEQARKQAGFLVSRLTAQAKPCVMICKTDTPSVLTRPAEAVVSGPYRWLWPLCGEQTSQAETYDETHVTEGGETIVVRDTQSLLYIGEDLGNGCNVFVTSPENVCNAITGADDANNNKKTGQASWVAPRVLCGLVGSEDERSLLGLGLSMAQWHAGTRYCARCGAATRVERLGYCIGCTRCGHMQYPSVQPAMIVAVLDGAGHVLLSQHKQRYFTPEGKVTRTILAGYVDQGESLEETVRREVHEESGVNVTTVHYVGSQAWPFPHTLMLGFYAVAETGAGATTPRPDEEELDSVQWVSRAELQRAIAGEHNDFAIPPNFAMAHVLLRHWANGDVDDQGHVLRVTQPNS